MMIAKRRMMLANIRESKLGKMEKKKPKPFTNSGDIICSPRQTNRYLLQIYQEILISAYV